MGHQNSHVILFFLGFMFVPIYPLSFYFIGMMHISHYILKKDMKSYSEAAVSLKQAEHERSLFRIKVSLPNIFS